MRSPLGLAELQIPGLNYQRLIVLVPAGGAASIGQKLVYDRRCATIGAPVPYVAPDTKRDLSNPGLLCGEDPHSTTTNIC